ncbi:MAG: CO/xanthine dehydrogenase FAD-binding subunit, partial [Oceanicoccus sp.]
MMAITDYKVPQSMDEAVQMLAISGNNIKVLAGGTDLI